MKLFNEKRSDLEEQQLHLNVGLQKIRETVDQVEDLQKSLSIKRNELEEKNNLANAKLKQMVSDGSFCACASGRADRAIGGGRGLSRVPTAPGKPGKIGPDLENLEKQGVLG